MEHFFLLLLFINPLLDMLGGVCLGLAGTYGMSAVTPSLVI
jgi:hypothetical protein